MNDLYEKLIAQGLDAAIAQQLASEYIPKRSQAKVHKATFAEWAGRYAESETKSRLQAIVSVLAQLGISVSTEMVSELKDLNPNTQELMRRLGQLMDSRWIPQKDTGGKLTKLVSELGEAIKTGPTKSVESNPDLDGLLNDLSNVQTVEDAVEEENVDDDPTDKDEEITVDIESTNEEGKPVITIVGSPVAPQPLDLDLDKYM